MKTLIILNGKCESLSFLKELSLKVDKVICADGGYIHAQNAGIVPDIVVGDFDSCVVPKNIKTVVFPKEKDLNDAEIAINYAIEHYGDDIVLSCALGGRLDHQMFNLHLLFKYNKVIIEETDVKVIYCDNLVDFNNYIGKSISFLPYEKANISLEGFKYPLYNADLKIGDTLTLSNIALENAKLIVNSGKVLAVICKTVI